jgi:hypothetical protein
MPTSNLDGSEARAREEFKADFGITFDEFDQLEHDPEALWCLSKQRLRQAADRARWAQDDANDAAERERRGLLGLRGGYVGK